MRREEIVVGRSYVLYDTIDGNDKRDFFCAEVLADVPGRPNLFAIADLTPGFSDRRLMHCGWFVLEIEDVE